MNSQFFGGMNLGPMQGPQLGPMQGPQLGPMQGPQAGQMRNSQMGSMGMVGSESMFTSDPGVNNQPLQFKGGKTSSSSMSGDNGNGNNVSVSNSGSMGAMQPPPQPPMMTPQNMMNNSNAGGGAMMSGGAGIMGAGPGGMMMNPWGNMMGMGSMDPTAMMMWGAWTGMGGTGIMGGGGGMEGGGMDMMMLPQVQREVVTLKGATLYPPPPSRGSKDLACSPELLVKDSRPQGTRERPPGCRTAFVGGIPDNMTEDMVREMFTNCGTICSLRVSKKNFAHVRFEEQEAVEKALFYSGYRVKVDEKDDKPNAGRIHVDYAQARDDQHEYEVWERAQAREARHRERLHEDMMRPPSPPKTIHYSDGEAMTLIDTLKSDETFVKSIETLITWFERGDCTRRTAGMFYSLIQSSNVHVRRLMAEKANYYDELEQMKIKFRQRLQAIINQFEQIDQVFAAASKQKSWDHFTKPQRKNIETWRKQLQDLKAKQEAEFMLGPGGGSADMDLSEEGEEWTGDAKRRKVKREGSGVAAAAGAAAQPTSAESLMSLAAEWKDSSGLRVENESLRCQLEAYRNEVELLKSETRMGDDSKDKQVKALQMALQGMQQQLISSNQSIKKTEQSLSKLQVENTDLKSRLLSRRPSPADLKNGGEDEGGVTEAGEEGAMATSSGDAPLVDVEAVPSDTRKVTGAPDSALSDKEARLVAVVSTFLHVHPSGANIDYIWSYLNRLDIKIRSSELEDLLEKYPAVFRGEQPGGGSSLETKWKFVGYTPHELCVLIN